MPALERLCRRFIGFRAEQAVPEQVAALGALATIGGPEAAAAVARLLGEGVVQGPTLVTAAVAAGRLRVRLAEAPALALLGHRDALVRAAACRCAPARPAVIAPLLALLDDLEEPVRVAAACALGRRGHAEARPLLLALLQERPSFEIVEAAAVVADEDGLIALGRLAAGRSRLADAALEALESLDHPLAQRRAAALRADRQEH